MNFILYGCIWNCGVFSIPKHFCDGYMHTQNNSYNYNQYMYEMKVHLRIFLSYEKSRNAMCKATWINPIMSQSLGKSHLLPNLTLYLIARDFHRTFAMGTACQQRTLTPPDTWSCPTLGLACVLMLRPIYSILNFEIPSVLLFCFELLITAAIL